jgi:hypothetical protein
MGTMAVADQQEQYDFASAEAKEMVADRERSWVGFTRAVVWSIGVVAAVLVLLLYFFG